MVPYVACECIQGRIQDFGQWGPASFDPRGESLAQNLLKIVFFPLKSPENCMILGARGGGSLGSAGAVATSTLNYWLPVPQKVVVSPKFAQNRGFSLKIA